MAEPRLTCSSAGICTAAVRSGTVLPIIFSTVPISSANPSPIPSAIFAPMTSAKTLDGEWMPKRPLNPSSSFPPASLMAPPMFLTPSTSPFPIRK